MLRHSLAATRLLRSARKHFMRIDFRMTKEIPTVSMSFKQFAQICRWIYDEKSIYHTCFIQTMRPTQCHGRFAPHHHHYQFRVSMWHIQSNKKNKKILPSYYSQRDTPTSTSYTQNMPEPIPLLFYSWTQQSDHWSSHPTDHVAMVGHSNREPLHSMCSLPALYGV